MHSQSSSLENCHLFLFVGPSQIGQLKETVDSVVRNSILVSRITILGTDEHKATIDAVISYSASSKLLIDTILFRKSLDCCEDFIGWFNTEDGGLDLIVLQAGIIVPPGWDVRLSRVAYADERMSTVSPMCDTSPLFSLIAPEFQGEMDCDSEELDRLLFGISQRGFHEVPCFFPGCFYLKRSALDLIRGKLGEPKSNVELPWWWEVARSLTMRGVVHVVSDHLYVKQCAACPGDIDVFLSQQGLAKAFNSAHPLTGLRHAFNDLVSRGISYKNTPGYDQRPVQIHLLHGWGGGLEQWVQDYCSADCSRINLVLKSVGNWGAFGQRLILYSDLNDPEPLRVWDLSLPIRATEITHIEYRQILDEILSDFGVDAIFVSSLIGHSLDALCTGKKTVVIGHDYYPFCPSICIHYKHVCKTCDVDKLSRCFADNQQNRFFKNVTPEEWLHLREAFILGVLENKIIFILPTPSVGKNLIQLDNRLREAQFYTIPHGIGLELDKICSGGQERTSSKLRILVLGSLAVHKGGELLHACYKALTSVADIFLVGCGPDGSFYEEKPGFYVSQSYEREKLYSIVEEIQPDIGMLLSVWPETFSYTLSELMEMGIPVVATNVGAFADRIQDGQTGFLVDPFPEHLTSKIKEISGNRDLIVGVKKRLRHYKHSGLKEMVSTYHKVIHLEEKAIGNYNINTIRGVCQTRLGQKNLAHEMNFPMYLSENTSFLREKISNTPLLRHWQRRIIIRVLERVNFVVAHCYLRLLKIRSVNK